MNAGYKVAPNPTTNNRRVAQDVRCRSLPSDGIEPADAAERHDVAVRATGPDLTADSDDVGA